MWETDNAIEEEEELQKKYKRFEGEQMIDFHNWLKYLFNLYGQLEKKTGNKFKIRCNGEWFGDEENIDAAN